jgi:hypothetical protein
MDRPIRGNRRRKGGAKDILLRAWQAPHVIPLSGPRLAPLDVPQEGPIGRFQVTPW